MQNSNVSALAQMLNSHKNPQHIGISIGEITKIPPDDPITITIADGAISLEDEKELVCTETIKNMEIHKGDKVLVVPTADEQKWIAVDRV